MSRTRTFYGILIFFSIFFLSVIAESDSMAQDSVMLEKVEAKKLLLKAGNSVILKSTMPIERISVAVPEIADFLLISPREIYLTAKAAGTTNMTFWQNGNVTAIYELEVENDLIGLKRQLNQIFPNEKELRVTGMNDSITLSGYMSSASNLAQALVLAKAYAHEGKINNLVEVGGVHQVMLEVRVAEMNRNVTKRLGINFTAFRGNQFVISQPGGLTSTDQGVTTFSSAVNALFRFTSGDTTWTGFVDALKQDGLAKILAEPTLIALSGQTAKFLAGGEFPVPVPDQDGRVTISYKEFGVGLGFTPTVLNEDKISINVATEVSELNFANAVQFSGFVVPGLTTRKASTSIELGDGQSFAIAGLLQENIRENISKFPLLGDIPILGALFRSSSFEKQETELVIIVTPRLVKPVNLAQQPLPTDYFVEPSNTEFYLEGMLEGRGKALPHAAGGTLDGDFGHSVPGTDK